MKKSFIFSFLILCLVHGAFAASCNHSFITDGYIKEADCENFGLRRLKCQICGEMKNEVIRALGHLWDSGTVTKNETCTENGIKTFKCTRCGKIKIEAIPSGHKWETKGGNYTALICSVCGSRKTGYGAKGPVGGYIFYDCDADNTSGNKDRLRSVECGWRYLEAAPEDLPETYAWGDDGSFGTKTGIGEGRNNTNIIVNNASNKRKDNAAMACVMYAGGGYSDWFLPSLDELNLMYENLKEKGVGNFHQDAWYWSGSENSYSNAWCQNFGNGRQYNDYRYYGNYDCCVRPVRAFI